MRKILFKLDLNDDKAKQKALKTAATLPGIDFISMDMKTSLLLVIGSVEPVRLASNLRKFWPSTALILVEPFKEEPKKEEGNKDEGKKEKENKSDPKMELIKEIKQMQQYNHLIHFHYHHIHSIEENPNACTIL